MTVLKPVLRADLENEVCLTKSCEQRWMKMKQKKFHRGRFNSFMPNNTCIQATLSIELTVIYVEKEKEDWESERERERGGKRERYSYWAGADRSLW